MTELLMKKKQRAKEEDGNKWTLQANNEPINQSSDVKAMPESGINESPQKHFNRYQRETLCEFLLIQFCFAY